VGLALRRPTRGYLSTRRLHCLMPPRKDDDDNDNNGNADEDDADDNDNDNHDNL